MPALLEAFERFCREHDWVFGFYQVRPEHLRWYRHARLERGAHRRGSGAARRRRFTLEGSALGTVRRQVRKLEKAGLVVRHFVPGRERRSTPRTIPTGCSTSCARSRTSGSRARRAARRASAWGASTPSSWRNVWLAVAWDPEAAARRGVLHLDADLGAARLGDRSHAAPPRRADRGDGTARGQQRGRRRASAATSCSRSRCRRSSRSTAPRGDAGANPR